MRWPNKGNSKGVTQTCHITVGYFVHSKNRLTFGWDVTFVWPRLCSYLLISTYRLCLSWHQSLPPVQDELLLLPQREAKEEEEGWFSQADPMCTWTAGTSHSAFILKPSIMLRGSHPGPELQNWHLGKCSAVKTVLAGQHCHMKRNALPFLFLKGKVNGGGWTHSRVLSGDVFVPCALLLDGFGVVWPRWMSWLQMGKGWVLHLQALRSLGFAWSVCWTPVSQRCVWLQAAQSCEKKCRLSGRAAELRAEVLLMMGCCSALRGEVCVVWHWHNGSNSCFLHCDLRAALPFCWAHPFEVQADLSLMIRKWNEVIAGRWISLGFIPGTLGFTGLVTGRRSGLHRYNRKLN